MSDTTEGGTNGGTVRYSVPQAARYLNISERAVRKRIDAGTLAAERDGNRWVVFLKAVPGAVPGPEHGGTASGTEAVPGPEPIEARYRVTPEEIEQAIERTGDRYVTDISALADRFDQLYAGRLADKDALIAEVRRRAEQAEAERNHERELREALESRVRELEAHTRESPNVADSAPQTNDAAPWWQFWRRACWRRA